MNAAEAVLPIRDDLLLRLVEALERLAPPPPSSGLEAEAEGYVWRPAIPRLEPVTAISRVDLSLLQGVDRQREVLLANTRAFARGQAANNALLWGARGTGKSSLVKAVHAQVNREAPSQTVRIALIEVQRDDIGSLSQLLGLLAAAPGRRFILFCDDLSFDAGEADYKSLKAVLDGGIAGRPANVVVYATSNRRHLLSRDMVENERSTAIHASEAVEEKISLSDRFGLWLGFENTDQDGYLAMVRAHAEHLGVRLSPAELERRALQWSLQRGSRSGRAALQFAQHLLAAD